MLPTTAVGMATAVARGEISARELVEASLSRIDETMDLNAFLTLCPERALEEANRIDNAGASGAFGVLSGVPIAVKDLHETQGVRTTYGSLRFSDHVPDRDCAVVARLRAAGAIVVGKTNTPAFGLISETKNRLGPPCANPFDRLRTSGGSSGGSAVAVAVGAVPLATGSDAAGSINVPSAFCGAFGFKPSVGVVATVPPGTCLAPLTSSGPISRTAQDAALAMDVLAGYDSRDPMSQTFAPGSFREALGEPLARGLRVAFSPDLGRFPVDAEIATAVERTAQSLAGIGCVVAHSHPWLDDPTGLYVDLYVPDARQAGFDDPATWRELHPEALAELRDRPRQSAEEYARLLNRWWALRATMREFFTRHDVLIVPTTATTAFPHDTMPTSIGGMSVEPVWTTWMPFTPIFNLTGQPCASVPTGLSSEGLPIGVMIVGAIGADAAVLRVARELVGS
ncbi:MAG TPA: amidase [Candidatus Saccharimonadales bacterium]|nr:amidase [Candidatus Saccharimonadales bacterium]